MSNPLELPDEIQHLIEKREAERRQQDAPGESADADEQLQSGEERRHSDRRAGDKA